MRTTTPPTQNIVPIKSYTTQNLRHFPTIIHLYWCAIHEQNTVYNASQIPRKSIISDTVSFEACNWSIEHYL